VLLTNKLETFLTHSVHNNNNRQHLFLLPKLTQTCWYDKSLITHKAKLTQVHSLFLCMVHSELPIIHKISV